MSTPIRIFRKCGHAAHPYTLHSRSGRLRSCLRSLHMATPETVHGLAMVSPELYNVRTHAIRSSLGGQSVKRGPLVQEHGPARSSLEATPMPLIECAQASNSTQGSLRMHYYLLRGRSSEILSLGTDGNHQQVAKRDCAALYLANPEGGYGGSLPVWPYEVQVLPVHMEHVLTPTATVPHVQHMGNVSQQQTRPSTRMGESSSSQGGIHTVHKKPQISKLNRNRTTRPGTGQKLAPLVHPQGGANQTGAHRVAIPALVTPILSATPHHETL